MVGIGIICVVIVVLFLSGIGSEILKNGSGTPDVSSVTSPAMQNQQPVTQAVPNSQSTAVNPSATIIPPPTPVPVPGTGVYVWVGYFGEYTGSYTANGVTQEIKSSGFHIYSIDQPSGTITASFEKSDNTIKHNLTVEIWKNGVDLASNVTYAPFGTVSVSANV